MQVVVLGNLREGVLTPDIYDPALNPLYRDVLAHYGVVALPYAPQRTWRRGFVTNALEGDKTASAVSDLLDLRRHMPSALIQLLSSGVTDENRIFTCPGVPATDSTVLP